MKKINYLAATVGVFFASQSHSMDFDNCKIIEVVVMGPNNGHVQLDCTIGVRPACSAGDYFGFDKSTEEGKMYMSMVLTAFASGARVSGFVNDTSCSPHQVNVALLEHLRLKK